MLFLESQRISWASLALEGNPIGHRPRRKSDWALTNSIGHQTSPRSPSLWKSREKTKNTSNRSNYLLVLVGGGEVVTHVFKTFRAMSMQQWRTDPLRLSSSVHPMCMREVHQHHTTLTTSTHWTYIMGRGQSIVHLSVVRDEPVDYLV